jgi:hypothetical protein
MGNPVLRAHAPNGTRHHLEHEHQRLKRQVAELDRRAYLTPQEQVLVTELKKRKLAMKDALNGLRTH